MSFPAMHYVSLTDHISFPATPEEMYRLLELEQQAKTDSGLTHRSMNGYLLATTILTDSNVTLTIDEARTWG